MRCGGCFVAVDIDPKIRFGCCHTLPRIVQCIPICYRNFLMMLQGRRIIGVTLRIGRYFPGSAGFADDLLFHVRDTEGGMD